MHKNKQSNKPVYIASLAQLINELIHVPIYSTEMQISVFLFCLGQILEYKGTQLCSKMQAHAAYC
jgi:hypothetical protein